MNRLGLIQENLEKIFKEFDILKGKKTGICIDTFENRKLGRVGQKYIKEEVLINNHLEELVRNI